MNRNLFTRRGRQASNSKAKPARGTRALYRPLGALEMLEARSLMAADLRTYDGTGNNLVHPEWGSTDESLLRKAVAAYADGVAAPAGATRLSAREISNLLAAHPVEAEINDRALSAFIYAWGQFLDHDLDLTPNATPAEAFNIAVPTGDASFDPAGTGTQTIGLSRSEYDTATGTGLNNPRQQVNTITAFIDASQVYGSDAERAAALRTFSGGHLKTSAGNLLPYNTAGLANGDMPGVPESAFFLAGDVRANENIELTAMHTLFVREHNRLADQFAAAHPTWTDEQIYQEARRWVGAEIQAITYNEFLPALLGQGALQPYRGYNAKVNPGITNEFSTAAFRLGHSLLGDDVEFLDNNGAETHAEVALRDAFFNPALLSETGIDGIMKYLASDRAEELDTHVIDDVRNFLFGPPGAGGLDLASLNIQRGRDHGLADYNSVRVAYGLKPVRSFADITSNQETQAALQAAYGSVNNIDLWVGGLAEDHVPGASVGPLFQRILADQFQRLRDGDRFWYENAFRGAELDTLRHTTLADVIRRNSTTTNLQQNVFFFDPVISGRVAGGQSLGQVLPLANIEVKLFAADGSVVATTRTDRQGRYEFHELELATYEVRLTVPSGYSLVNSPAPVTITQGNRVADVDVNLLGSLVPGGNTRPKPGPLPPPLAPAPRRR